MDKSRELPADHDKGSTASRNPCSVALALSKVGDHWSMLILRDVARGLTRFDQLRVNLGIAPNILTRRLRALVDAHVLSRHRYSERPPRDEYVLTDAGREFLPVLYVLAEWGRRQNSGVNLTRLMDLQTGELVEPLVIDRLTGLSLSDREIGLVTPSARVDDDA